MPEAVIIDAARTPMGRYGGILKDIRPDDLAAHIIARLIARNGIDKDTIEDVILGCTNQAGEDCRNVGRNASLLAGIPESVPGATVNRLCGSGLEAVNQAGRAVGADEGDLFVAGGVEMMTRAPLVMPKGAAPYARGDVTVYDSVLGWRFPNPRMGELYPLISLGETAENVAEKYSVTREQQDAFGFKSHRNAVAAQEAGRLDDEIIPVAVPQRRGDPVVHGRDEGPRPDTSMEQLAALRPAFAKNGTVTAGNSSPLSDGAAALLVASREKAEALKLKPIVRIVASAVAGVDPAFMGIGPIPASRKALERAGLSADQLDLVELNEAFASQSLACVKELGLDPDRVNVNGGAIALGHPLGCSGARIMTTLIHEMKRRGSRYGMATMCIGVGQGIATVVERAD
ncbi:MAG: thiolase family protein [Deltaproteobacteria bacterium]|nr:thiolase family protein [Deltaproteobacteria bacterium]